MGAHAPGAAVRANHERHLAFGRLVSSAVGSQALLSGGNFIVGLVLLRSTSDAQYGYYILATSALLLAVSLQNAFFNPPLARRLPGLDSPATTALIAALYREQRRILAAAGVLATVLAGAFGVLRGFDHPALLLSFAAIAAAFATLYREYFRMVLFAERRAYEVLKTDGLYMALFVVGVLAATQTRLPAVGAVLALGAAAWAAGALLARRLPADVRGVNPASRPGTDPRPDTTARTLIGTIAPTSLWSSAGAAVHWTFSQGFIYLVAGTLDVGAVAALAGTRLLMMPMNLLAAGIGSLMLPLASSWLHHHGASVLWRRVCLCALGLATVTLGYFSLVWTARDWIFTVLLHKSYRERDLLLVLWGAVVLLIVIRDQLVYLLAAQSRFRVLTLITLASAAVSLCSGYLAMRTYGVAGALVGVLIGELLNLAGIVLMSRSPGGQAAGLPV
jgi:O-antigen/teichoic acid export membrane protein